jgi:hypothetical protein
MSIDALSLEIERRATKVGFIEAIIDFCEEKEILEYEDILEHLHPITKEKIKQEFIDKNFIPSKKSGFKLDNFFKD